MSERQHFVVRLVPPRPTFPFDMDDRERALMGEHVEHLQAHHEAGRVVLFGPVLDGAGPYGLAVLLVADEAEARAIFDADPTVVAGLNTYELGPARIVGP